MTLLSVGAAQKRILRRVDPVGTEKASLTDCARRILARDVLSTDLPRFDNSSVDGFAVKATDVAGAAPSAGRRLRVVADIAAGSDARITLKRGQAARIMTGAPLPHGADAVVMIEDTDCLRTQAGTAAPDWVLAFRSASSGENVRRRGLDVRRGHKILFAGHALRAQDLGLLAMLGLGEVRVYRRPRAALLSSGNELVPLGRALRHGQIRDTNSYTLHSLIRAAGCEVIDLGIARDEKPAIQARLDRAVARRADIIVSSAGVSVGALDLVRDVVSSRGHLDFWRVNVRPGKPLAFGDYRGIPLIGLPGNPVSAFVGFELFVRPALNRLAGAKGSRRTRLKAKLAESVDSDGRETYLRAVVEEQRDGLQVRLTGHQGSGNLLSLVQANALLLIPAGVKSLAVGDWADVWLL